MIFEVFAITSIASLVGLAFQLYKHKEKPFTYVLLSITFLSSIISTALWVEGKELKTENTQLKNAQVQASRLINTWPKFDKFEYKSICEFRGIVISGMAFLETNKAVFTETYKLTKNLMFNEFQASSNNEGSYTIKRMELQEAAEAMITTIKAIRLNSKIIKTNKK